jgi:hypothetical protein
MQGHPIDPQLLNRRLFVEAELPFFDLDSKYYPPTTQGNFRIMLHLKKIIIDF